MTDNTESDSSIGKTDSPVQEEHLRRSITGPQLFFYVLGDVLGSGIYALIGIMAFEVGGAFWLSFLVGVTVALLTGFAYAELITKYPQAAGASLYVHKAFGKKPLTFLVTFCLLSATISAAGALALVFGGEYFTSFIEDALTTLIAIIFIILLSLLNFRGISESVWANVVMTLIETAGLIIILIIGAVVLGKGDADLSQPFDLNDGNPALVVLGGAAVAFFAMTGFENAANVAEETKNPSKAFPRALLGGMALAGVLYLLIAFIASMVAPLDELTKDEGAGGTLLTVVEAGPIPIPALIFSAIALVAVTNTTLVSLVAQARIMYGMARQNVVPRIFARTHHTRQTPWVAIIFTASLVCLLLVTTDVGTLADVTVLFLIAVYGMVCLAALVLRRRTVNHEHYTAPTTLLVVGVVGNAALLLYTAVTSPDSLLYCGVMLAIGAALYFVNNASPRTTPPSSMRTGSRAEHQTGNRRPPCTYSSPPTAPSSRWKPPATCADSLTRRTSPRSRCSRSSVRWPPCRSRATATPAAKPSRTCRSAERPRRPPRSSRPSCATGPRRSVHVSTAGHRRARSCGRPPSSRPGSSSSPAAAVAPRPC